MTLLPQIIIIMKDIVIVIILIVVLLVVLWFTLVFNQRGCIEIAKIGIAVIVGLAVCIGIIVDKK